MTFLLPVVADAHKWADAECATWPDPDIWYRDDNLRDARLAIEICHTCPLQAQCAADNLHEVDGIWGGMTPRQRKAARTKASES
jgi:hypothetical protein